MTQDNITIVRRLTQEGFVGGHIEVVDDLVAEDYVDHDPLPAQVQGREGQKQACRMVVNGLSDRRTLQEDFLAVGDKVIESWIFQGTHTGEFMAVPASGRQIQIRGIEIWRCANDRIVERWGSIDTGAVMAQLAAMPTP